LIIFEQLLDLLLRLPKIVVRFVFRDLVEFWYRQDKQTSRQNNLPILPLPFQQTLKAAPMVNSFRYAYPLEWTSPWCSCFSYVKLASEKPNPPKNGNTNYQGDRRHAQHYVYEIAPSLEPNIKTHLRISPNHK